MPGSAAGAEESGAGRVPGRRVVWGAVAAGLVLLPVVARPAALAVAVSAALAVFVAVLRWPWGRVTLGAAAGAVVAVGLAADVLYRGPQDLATLWTACEYPALLVLVGRVVRREADRVAAVVGTLAVAAVVLLPLRFAFAEPRPRTGAVALLCSMSLFPAVCAAGIALYLRSLDNRRRRAVEKARRDQRLEVAGELHDFVAHEVTGILLEVQAAQVADYDAQQVRELLQRLEEAGLRALDSMDRTVGTLRDPEGERASTGGELPSTRLYGLADLAEMVERFASSGTGVRASLELAEELRGDAGRGSAREVEDAVHRVVLEALTNVRRHAVGVGGVAVRVGLLACPGVDAVEVTVTDDGSGGGGGRGARRHGGGTGLAGLRARVEALGGTLEYGPHGSGWRVRAVLPGPA